MTLSLLRVLDNPGSNVPNFRKTMHNNKVNILFLGGILPDLSEQIAEP